ncbi:hypothetical protein Btru_000907 [Bulinus truncatus]|nr:hypothetical protein Btru_000907 [Bulinus truncatus]
MDSSTQEFEKHTVSGSDITRWTIGEVTEHNNLAGMDSRALRKNKKNQREVRYFHWIPVDTTESKFNLLFQEGRLKKYETNCKLPLCRREKFVPTDADNDVGLETSPPASTMLPVSSCETGDGRGISVIGSNQDQGKVLRQQFRPPCHLRRKVSGNLRHVLYTGYSYSLVVPVDTISQTLLASQPLEVKSLGPGQHCSVYDTSTSKHTQSLSTDRDDRKWLLPKLHRSSTCINDHFGRNDRSSLQPVKRISLRGENNIFDVMSTSSVPSDIKLLAYANNHVKTLKSSAVKSSFKSPEVNHVIKTLSPSKYGYHPRSQSPTFKCLVAASERLQEVKMSDESEQSISTPLSVIEDSDGSEIEDSLPHQRHPSLTNIETLTLDSFPANIDLKSPQDEQRLEKKTIGLNTFQFDPLRPDRRVHSKVCVQDKALDKGHGTTNQHFSVSRPEPLPAVKQTKINRIRNANLDSVQESCPAAEIETHSGNGYATHIHLFLPNILPGDHLTGHDATDLSDVRRTDLSGQHENNQRDNNRSITSDPDESAQIITPTRSVTSPPFQDKTKRKGSRIFLADQQAIQKVKKDKYARKTSRTDQHVAKQSVKKHSPRRRVSVCTGSHKIDTSSGNNVSSPPPSSAHSDHQMQSERLKKQLDDFPTLISLNYS